MATLKEVKRIGFRPMGRRGWYGYLQFRAEFEGQPDDRDVGEAQMQAGYDPRGYGPLKIIGKQDHGDGTYSVDFEVSNNSD
jgi:hypothetical protein